MPRYWMGVVCDNDRSRTNVHSWFQAFVPDGWGLPLKAEVQEDCDTGRETAMRALYRLADGRLKEALRSRSSGHITVTLRDPCKAILVGFSPPQVKEGGN